MTKEWINHGFTLNGGAGSSEKEDSNAILVDPLFKKAKNNDAESGKQLWSREWHKDTAANQERLNQAIQGAEEILFISVPGTTRKNRIPISAAIALAEAVGDKARFINGDKAFIPIHTSMMKAISRGERVFHPRVFEARHSIFTAIRESCPNARCFVVEDLLTTGNSAHSFQRFLEKNGIPVVGVIAMKGEYEPNVAPNLVKKIDKFFRQNDIPVDAEKLSLELTGKEAQTIAFQVSSLFKNADSEHQSLFRNLFKTLYEIRVNNNHKLLPQMDEMGRQLTSYLSPKEKEKSHEQHQTENTTSQKKNKIAEVLTQNSAGKISRNEPTRTAKNGPEPATGWVRDNAGQPKSSGNEIPPPQPRSGITPQHLPNRFNTPEM